MIKPLAKVLKIFIFAKQEWDPDEFGFRSPRQPETKSAKKCYTNSSINVARIAQFSRAK